MMTVTEVRRHRTFKQVRIHGIGGETDEQVLDLALRSAGETRVRLFGWDLSYFNGGTEVLVDLLTD